MRILFQPPIMDRLRRACAEARKDDRTIEKVVLDRWEWNELIAYLGSLPSNAMLRGEPIKVHGVAVECE